ncbi:hypothetical protein ACFL2Q_07350 [Thermodesulfobacteriota bacterium]
MELPLTKRPFVPGFLKYYNTIDNQRDGINMELKDEENAMAEQPKPLRFTCPHCGSHTLKQYDENPYYWECDVSVWLEDKDDPDTVQIDSESETVYTRRGDPVGELGWCCADCETVLCYEGGSSIGTESCLAEWLLENSPEEDDCRDLEFKCPECGGDTLELSDRISIKAVLTERGQLETVGGDVIHGEERVFGCWRCDFVIQDENGPIWDVSSVVAWLKKNCKQDD